MMHDALVAALKVAADRARARPEVAALVPPYLLREAAAVIEDYDMLQKNFIRQEAEKDMEAGR